MKKRLLFVLDSLLSNSANAVCVKLVSNYLQDDFEIDYLSIEYKRFKPVCETNIYVVESDTRLNVFLKFKRMVFKFFHIPIESRKVVCECVKTISFLNKANNYDTIIAVQNPCEATEAVFNYKNSNDSILTILYEIDPASNRYRQPSSFFEKFWTAKTKQWEKRVYSGFDYIIHMETHKNHFNNQEYMLFSRKTFFLDIPVLQNKVSKERTGLNSKIRFLYSGAFYKELREPHFLIEVFKHLSLALDFDFDIYTSDAFKRKISKSTKGYANFHLFDYISQENLDAVICKTDVLISVGNKDSDYLPSKTISYLGTLKPIIHFAFNHNDSCLSYLKNYPRCLVVYETEDVLTIINKINSFIEMERENIQLLDYHDLESKLEKNTPLYTANKIKEIIRSKFDDHKN